MSLLVSGGCLLDPRHAAVSNGVGSQWRTGRFRMTEEEVAAELRQGGLSVNQLLCALTAPAKLLARPPISDFQVGAVALGSSGRLFIGVNLEFPGLPLHHSVHAEQFLIANAVQAGELALTQLAVSAVPCGHCRQFCSELACADDLVFLLGDGRRYTLEELLPVRFRPSDLLDKSVTPLLLQPQRHSLHLRPEALALLKTRARNAVLQRAACAALEAACSCYAPYTHSASGVAVVLGNGTLCSGGYLESAAFNPSLPPLQAALVAAVISGLQNMGEIMEVVLVERHDARVTHAAATRLMLSVVAPRAQLTLLLADSRTDTSLC